MEISAVCNNNAQHSGMLPKHLSLKNTVMFTNRLKMEYAPALHPKLDLHVIQQRESPALMIAVFKLWLSRTMVKFPLYFWCVIMDGMIFTDLFILLSTVSYGSKEDSGHTNLRFQCTLVNRLNWLPYSFSHCLEPNGLRTSKTHEKYPYNI